jgi:hypothetical protein
MVLGGVMLVGVAACGTASPKPEVKIVDTTVAFPNVIGMGGQQAENTIEVLFPNGSAMTEVGGDMYEYELATST